VAFLAIVIAQRLGELIWARQNTARLLAGGAREVGAAHYPLIVALHAAWLAALLYFGWDAPVSVVWLAVYAALQVFRTWILASLGRRWTTRIIVTDEPPVTAGPYRYVRHPNYMLVAAEIAVVPLALHQLAIAIVFSVLNAAALAIRISIENKALKQD